MNAAVNLAAWTEENARARAPKQEARHQRPLAGPLASARAADETSLDDAETPGTTA